MVRTIKKNVVLLGAAHNPNEEVASIVYQILHDAGVNKDAVQYIRMDVEGNIEYGLISVVN